MSKSSLNINWDALLECWSVSEAVTYLNDKTVKPLPKRGRLQQLLARTQQILSEGLSKDFDVSHAEEAVHRRVVFLLAKLLHLLQQCPSKEVNCAPNNHPFKSVWLCILAMLELIGKHISKGGYMKALSDMTRKEEFFTTEAAFKLQLEEAAGMPESPALAAWPFANSTNIDLRVLTSCMWWLIERYWHACKQHTLQCSSIHCNVS
jgi:hypothetical protein